MALTLNPRTESRIADLAERLGISGPDALETTLGLALNALDAQAPGKRRKMTPEEIEEELRILDKLREPWRRWREEHADEFDEDNPPSKVLQEELYDENGLPR